MSIAKCSVHRATITGKLASVYWAWFDASGGRHAYKMRYCPSCFEESCLQTIRDAGAAAESDEVFACIACGSNVGDASDPIWATVYLPKREPLELALQLDAACAAKMRVPIVAMGEKLPDRSDRWEARDSGVDPWGALVA